MTERVRIYLTKEQIHKKVQELAAQVEADYGEGPIYLVCVLRGGVVFLTDLARAIHKTQVYYEFMEVSSYGDDTVSSGRVRILKDMDTTPDGKDILIVEDIVDTGRTLTALKQLLLNRGAKSVRICAILDKPSRRETELKPDYVGFTVPNEFLVGYGLDYAQRYRNLDFVGILDFLEE